MAKPIRVGIIGSNFAATLHAESYRRLPGVQMVAAASLEADLPQFCRQYGIPSHYDDYRRMRAEHRPDLVSVCVPNYLHNQMVLACTVRNRSHPGPLTLSELETIAADLNLWEEMIGSGFLKRPEAPKLDRLIRQVVATWSQTAAAAAPSPGSPGRSRFAFAAR